MTITFPIVGIRHCLDESDVADLVNSLPDGARVRLQYDDSNAYDRYAIQAWMELSVDDVAQNMQVGYVAADYAPMIRANYPKDDFLYASVVHPDTSIQEETSFEVELEIDKPTLPPIVQRLDLSPIANIPLTMVSPEKKMAFENIITYSHEEIKPNMVLELARRYKGYLGHGLSGEERNAYILLSTMLTYAHGLWSEQTEAIWEERMDIDDTHRDTFKTPERCAQIMAEEIAALRERATSFFEQYEAALKSGLTTREQELIQHEQWLRNLPDNLYAYIKDKNQLASKLYYERFTMEELGAIYLHLLCVERLSKKEGETLPDFAEQAISTFSFWADCASITKKRKAVLMWREAAAQDKEPVATLALRTKQLQNQCIIVRKLKPLTKFVDELNRFLDTPIKENSFRRRFVPPHHDAYDND